MSSFRCDLIDVNRNSGLLSSPYRACGDLSQSAQALELQEQLKSCRRELAKKENLIADLSVRSPRHGNRDILDVTMDASSCYNGTTSRTLLGFSNPEVSSGYRRNENFGFENREVHSKLEMKDNIIFELRSRLKTMKEDEAHKAALIQSLREHIMRLEQKPEGFDFSSSKSSITIHTLQRENREAQEKIMDLGARLRNHAILKEGIEQEDESYKRKYHDAIAQIGDALNTGTDAGHMENAVEVLVEKGKVLCQDNLLLVSKLQSLDDTLNSHSLETKTNRETIMRLVSEVGKEQKTISDASYTAERLRKERDEAVLEKESLTRELDLLKERLVNNDRTWVSSREELTQAVTKANLLSEDVKTIDYERNVIENEFQVFRESMAKILSDPYVEVDAREDAIKDRIRELAAGERERKSKIDILESRITELSNQLERQCELHQDALRRAKKVELSTFHRQDKWHELQTEFTSGCAMRETMRQDKEKYQGLLRRMAIALRINDMSMDHDFDLHADAIVDRANQLARQESDAVAETTSSNFNLHRKFKALKDHLKDKELHMEIMRKKIIQLESSQHVRFDTTIGTEDTIGVVQKLQRKVERLKQFLSEERIKVAELETQLVQTNELKDITLEQRRKIDRLANSVGKLSTSRERQKQRLSYLKRDLTATEMSADEKATSLKSQLDAITDELNSTKITMDDLIRREKQLIDFREAVARMLGLNVNLLTIPDYEVLSRLEKLVRKHRFESSATEALDLSLNSMGSGFKTGYKHTCDSTPYCSHLGSRLLRHRHRSVSPRRHHHHRGRSVSPTPRY